MSTESTKLNVMVDIETLGTLPGSGILSIGARAESGEEFYTTISIESNTRAGLSVDQDTLIWHLQNYVPSTFIGNQYLVMALNDFNNWLYTKAPKEDLILWCKGASFDFSLLRVAYAACRIKPYWDFRNERCLRTLLKVSPPKAKLERLDWEATHDAIGDARYQMRQLKEILNESNKSS